MKEILKKIWRTDRAHYYPTDLVKQVQLVSRGGQKKIRLPLPSTKQNYQHLLYILPFRTSSSLISPSPGFTSSVQHYRFSDPHFAKHSSTLIAIFDGMAFRTFSMSSPAILCPKVRAITPSLKENSCSATRLTANSSDVNAAVKFAGSHSGFTCVWNDPAG